MTLYELSIRKLVHHFSQKVSFSVQEMESGEELFDCDTFDEAEHFMFKFIKEHSEYFTNQELIQYGEAYRLKRLGAGSEHYGVCELCGKTCDSTYLLTHMKRYWSVIDKKDSISHYLCKPLVFGHKSCLTNTAT
ncbi:MAG: hypothetical protein V7749_00740 [Cocleimonas sp.]